MFIPLPRAGAVFEDGNFGVICVLTDYAGGSFFFCSGHAVVGVRLVLCCIQLKIKSYK
jgi:hypothetical protein